MKLNPLPARIGDLRFKLKLPSSNEIEHLQKLISELRRAKLDAIKSFNNDLTSAARLLRAERESYGVSLRALASQMKFSAAYVSDVELGRRGLSEAFLKKYFTALTQLLK